MSLMGVTGGSAGLGRAVMANGANLAFRKELFVEAGGYEGNTQYASGDDMFLLHKFKRLPGVSIIFLKDPDAVVCTQSGKSIGALFRQRGRWVSKTAGYNDRFTLFTAGVVAAQNILLLASLPVIPFASWPLNAAIALAWLLKMAADFALLIAVTHFFKRKKLLWYFPLVSVLYPLYVLLSLLAGAFRMNRW